MRRSLSAAAALVLLSGAQTPAQRFTPGYVDPAPILAAAAREIGEADFTCVTFSGTGYGAAVGQTFENAVNIDWPRIDALANYTRTINWKAGTSVETFDRKPGLNPASWKYGLGWQDGTPTQKALRQTHIVNGTHAWHIDGDGPPVAVPPELAELYQLDLWLNPPGFLKAARMPGANPVALWRWEQIEKGRDGNVVSPEKVHVVAITMFGKYRVDATINSRNQITRIKTTVNEPALGDFNIEHESTEQMTFGSVKWPIAWHSHHGWDDNWQFYRQSTGHNGYGGKFPTVQPNACGQPVPVPPQVASASFEPPPVTVEKMADGVYLLGGGPANSYMVEFDGFVAVFEAPTNEERSLAVIEAIAKLAPGQTDPLADQLAPALRSHRRPAHLPPHRLHHRHAHEEPRVPQPRRAELRAAHGEARHRREVAADRGVGGLQLRGGSGELRHHRQSAHPSRLLCAAAAARGRHAHGVPPGRAHRVPGRPLRHARGAALGAAAVDANAGHTGGAHEAGCRHAGAGARQAGAVEYISSGAEVARGIGL